MIYRDFQHKKYKQSNRSQRHVEIREGHKEVPKKRYEWHMASSEIRREGKVICKISFYWVIPRPGSISLVCWEWIIFPLLCFQLEFGMKIDWHNEVSTTSRICRDIVIKSSTTRLNGSQNLLLLFLMACDLTQTNEQFWTSVCLSINWGL